MKKHPGFLDTDYVRELRILFQVYAQTERDALDYSVATGGSSDEEYIKPQKSKNNHGVGIPHPIKELT